MAQTFHPIGARHGACEPSPRSDVVGALCTVARTLGTWLSRSRQRQDLADLGDHLLKDIGVTRAAAEAESRKSFWQ